MSIKHNVITSKIANLLLKPFIRNVEAYIFVATTGRSGTASLEKVLSALDQCTTHHEVYPIMHGEVMAAYNNNNPAPAMRMYNFNKSINIKRTAIGHKYYAETNHMFIKSFIEFAAVDLNKKLKVIHLIRDPVEVAMSISSLGHEPGTAMGNKWYIDYHAPKNIIQISEILDMDSGFNHPFYRSLWYWYEIEERICYWKQHLTSLSFYEFLTNDLNNKDKLLKLFQDMGLAFNHEKIAKVANTRENRKLSIKNAKVIDRQSANDMHVKFQRLLIDHGYSLPETLSYFSKEYRPG